MGSTGKEVIEGRAKDNKEVKEDKEEVEVVETEVEEGVGEMTVIEEIDNKVAKEEIKKLVM
jgi:hypothetical protein